jgi:hypothetical protein
MWLMPIWLGTLEQHHRFVSNANGPTTPTGLGLLDRAEFQPWSPESLTSNSGGTRRPLHVIGP